ncbi:DUF2975 domain-containing protein [Microbacterium enclense]|uniref:DUF2975 domain-containing protein n=1 Tax=Microbacterium enclense TaxID=993073 RepID=A0A3S3P1Z2_9MICO|nr:DUF2975 domain-containing protein [Microbacterium enclense]RWR16339.1 DUF2975 domain-containing protein [Microbacterium enclense]
MNVMMTRAAQAAIALALAGSILVEGMILPAVYRDLEGTTPVLPAVFVGLLAVGVIALQVCGVCVWRLLSKTRRGVVFAETSFREVDVIAWSLATVAIVLAAIGIILAPGEIAPGVVGLICGAAVVMGGACLLVVVLRGLLRQAIASEGEILSLRGELGEVI